MAKDFSSTATEASKEAIRISASSVTRLATWLLLALALGACSPEATVPELLDRAGLAIERGEARAAEIDVKTALQQAPDSARARRLLGEIYLFQQNPAAAVEEFERALGVAGDEETQVLYARALLEAGSGERLLELDEQNEFTPVEDNPRYLATIARAQGNRGELANASASLDAALAAAPDDPYVATTQALFMLLVSGMAEEAEAALQETVASHPEYEEAWRLLGGIQQMKGELAEAETSYARAAELNPYQLLDRLSLVTVLLDQGKTDEADTLMQRLLASNPDHPGVNFLHGRMLLESGDNTAAIAAFRKVFGVAPDHPGSLYLAAVANFAEGNLATARGHLDRLLTLQPNNTEGYVLLARIELRSGEPGEAEQHLRQALAAQPESVAFRGLLIDALLGQGKLREADTLLTEFPEDLASEPAVLVARGRIALAEDRPGEAEPLLRSALEQSPDSRVVLWLNTAMEAQGRDDEALLLLDDWLDEYPGDTLVRNQLAAAHLQAGREPEALAQYQILLEAAPDNAIVLNNLAWLLRKDDPQQALSLIQKADSALPDYPQILDTYALIQLELGATGEALSLNQRALDGAPDNPDMLYNRAMMLRADGQREEAIRILEGLVDSADGNRREEARSLLTELQGL